jgi:hypothetical protein
MVEASPRDYDHVVTVIDRVPENLIITPVNQSMTAWEPFSDPLNNRD